MLESFRAEQSRAEGLDALKLICAFLVICIHSPFPGIIGEYILVLARIAVPMFFIISGFYYQDMVDSSKHKRQTIKIAKLVIFSNILYLVLGIIKTLLLQESTSEYLFNCFSLSSIAKMIVFNLSPFSGHLWYLFAILYVLFLFNVLCHFGIKIERKIYILIPVLFLLYEVLGTYSVLIFGHNIPRPLVRNFLFVGIPYFLLGYFLHTKIDKIRNLSPKILGFLIVIAYLICVLEKQVLIRVNAVAAVEHYFGTILLSLFMFLFFLKAQPYALGSGLRKIGMLGRKYSTDIYIYHQAFIDLFGILIVFAGLSSINSAYSVLSPIIVFFIALTFVYLMHRIRHEQG